MKKTITIDDFRSALQSEFLRGCFANHRAQKLSDEDLLQAKVWDDLHLNSMDFIYLIVALERQLCVAFPDDGESFEFFEEKKNRKLATVEAFLKIANQQINL